MRSLAVKIFLSFWVAQVVILVGLEIMRPRAPGGPPPRPAPSPVFIPTPVLVAAVIVSAVVCFLLARHLASPLRRVREASGAARFRRSCARGPVRWCAHAATKSATSSATSTRWPSGCHLLVSSQKQLSVRHLTRAAIAARAAASGRRARAAKSRTGCREAPEPHRGGRHAHERDDRPDPHPCAGRQRQTRRHRAGRPGSTSCGAWRATPTMKPVSPAARCASGRHAKRMVMGDAALLTSAVENVVRNACPLHAAGTSVDISLDVTPTHARIVVRDHGPGVPPDDIERIFLPFHRVGASRDRDSGARGWASRSPRVPRKSTAAPFTPSTRPTAACK